MQRNKKVFLIEESCTKSLPPLHRATPSTLMMMVIIMMMVMMMMMV